MKKKMNFGLLMKIITFLFLSMFLQFCSNNTSGKKTSATSFISEDELKIFIDQNRDPRDWEFIDSSYIKLAKDPFNSSEKTCIPISVDELVKLFYAESRHKWLTERGYYLIYVGNYSYGHKVSDITENWNLMYGGCRLDAGMDYSTSHKTSISLRQKPLSDLTYNIKHKNFDEMEKTFSNLKSSFRRKFEYVKQNDDYGGRYEVFKENDIKIEVMDARFMNSLNIKISQKSQEQTN